MPHMMKMLVVAGLVSFVSSAQAGEESLPLKKLPKGVLAAVSAKFPGSKAIEAAKEEEDGETVYEVVITYKGSRIDVTVDKDGEIEGYEKTIDADDLPVRVAKAVAKAHPKAKATKFEAVYEVEDGNDELEYYEILLVNADKKEFEAKIKPNGSVFVEEKKEEAKDEKDEHHAKGKSDGKHEEKADKKKDKDDDKRDAKDSKKDKDKDKDDDDDDDKGNGGKKSD